MFVPEFDERSHSYRLDGEPVPGLTSVLSDVGFTDDQWFTSDSRDRGHAVHELAAEVAILERPDSDFEWDGGCGCGGGADCRHQIAIPYVRSFQLGVRKLGFVVEPGMIELAVATRLYRCAGTLDLWGWINRSRALIDLKSGKPQPGVDIQLAGYRLMARECRGIETDVSFALWLDKDGGMPKVVEPKRPAEDERIFRSVMEVWHWRKAHGLLPWKGKV